MLGDVIRARRKELRFSQATVAQRANVSQGYINKLELNQRPQPSWAVLGRIADTLQTDVDTLLQQAGLVVRPVLPGTADMPPLIARLIQRIGKNLTDRDWEMTAIFLEGLEARRVAGSETTGALGHQVPDPAEHEDDPLQEAAS